MTNDTKRERPLKVIQWGTGNVGYRALQGILSHPGLELVGVHAHSPDKVGKDAAELCGRGEQPTGIIATGDKDALLALDADCVCYMAIGETRVYEALDDWLKILSSGKNIANTATVSMVYPPFASRKLTGPLNEACTENGVAFYTSGFDPGFTNDLIPLVLAAGCERVDSVRVSEVMDYSTYADPNFAGEFFGFGHPLDFKAPMFYPGAIKAGWGSVIELLADALGFELDEVREESERVAAPETFDTKMGRIEKGTCAAVGTPGRRQVRLPNRDQGLPRVQLRDRLEGRRWRSQHRHRDRHRDAHRQRDPCGVQSKPRGAFDFGPPAVHRQSEVAGSEPLPSRGRLARTSA